MTNGPYLRPISTIIKFVELSRPEFIEGSKRIRNLSKWKLKRPSTSSGNVIILLAEPVETLKERESVELETPFDGLRERKVCLR